MICRCFIGTYLKSHFMPVRHEPRNKILLVFNAYPLYFFPAKIFFTFEICVVNNKLSIIVLSKAAYI